MNEHVHEYSVYTRCLECQMWGVNLPGDPTCGNCGAEATVVYKPPCCLTAAAQEREANLQAEVKEWLCSECNFVYPGPPSNGADCVLCRKCGGPTGPKNMIELRKAQADNAKLRGVVERLQNALKGWDALMRESRGVVGFHLNGDEANWDEFELKEETTKALAESADALGGK